MTLPCAQERRTLLQRQDDKRQLLHAENDRALVDPFLQPMRTLPRVGADDHGRDPLAQGDLGIRASSVDLSLEAESCMDLTDGINHPRGVGLGAGGAVSYQFMLNVHIVLMGDLRKD